MDTHTLLESEPLQQALSEVLACPACHAQLALESADRIRCAGCDQRYPILDGIPMLLPGHRPAQASEIRFREAQAMTQQHATRDALLRRAAQHHCLPVMAQQASAFYRRWAADQWILDVGIGYGWHWLSQTSGARILGVDLSLGNLRLAQQVLGSHPRVVLVCADAAALPIRDATITGLWSVQTLQHLPETVFAKFQEECDRVLQSRCLIELHNLNPALGLRAVYRLFGKRFHRRGSTGIMELNRLSARAWTQRWRSFRGGRCEIVAGYSELWFHPDLRLAPHPYPLQLESFVANRWPWLASRCARQVLIRITGNRGQPPISSIKQSEIGGCPRSRSVYVLPRAEQPWSIQALLGPGVRLRYFNYGRWALTQALRLIQVRPGDAVLMPELICRELLSSLHAVGARPVFYRVNEKLALADDPATLPPARAIIAVNYFGFPQDLALFEAYARRTRAVLIEDNAHGFLSKDAAGAWLGTRAPLGIFSFRKTIPLPNGAGLAVQADSSFDLPPQPRFDGHVPVRYRIKQAVRGAVPWLGERRFQWLLDSTRPLWPVARDETTLPESARPSALLADDIHLVDPIQETTRRQQLYQFVGHLLARVGVQPIFPTLPAWVVPYGYPFRAAGQLQQARAALHQQGLRCFQWPDLATDTSARRGVTALWCVRFLW